MLCNALVCLSGKEANLACQAAAIEFARKYGAHLTGLHVRETLGSQRALEFSAYAELTMPEAQWFTDQKDLETKAFAKFLSDASSRGLIVHTEAAAGNVLDVLRHRARSADLVFVGHGQSRDDFLLSSVGANVMREVERPVIFASEMSQGFERILLAFDGSRPSLRAMAVTADLCSRWAEPVRLSVLVVGSGEFAAQCRKIADSYLVAYPVDYVIQVEPGVASEVILEYAVACRAGLVSMGAYGHSLLREVLVGSTTEAVFRKRTEPLLLCR